MLHSLDKEATVRWAPALEPRPCTCHQASPMCLCSQPCAIVSAPLPGGGWDERRLVSAHGT